MRQTVLRTPQTHQAYEAFKQTASSGCPLCRSEPIHEFTHWKLIENDFPYDMVTDRHCMLVPKRHIATFEDLDTTARNEFRAVYRLDSFDAMLENFPSAQSQPSHYHVHLIRYKVV